MKLLVYSFLCVSVLHAGWNEDFDEMTGSLVDQIEEMQTESYLQGYEDFVELRDRFCQDSSLKKELRSASENDKFEMIKVREGVILKKRRGNNIKESYVWDIAQFAGSSEYMVPSFAMNLGGKKVVFQRLESFVFGEKETKQPPAKILKKVSLKTYWKAHLQAYLFGFSDLVGRNVGVNSEGVIRFFDNEASFHYRNDPIRSGQHVQIGFVSQSFDWPQYSQPLDKEAVEALEEFVRSLSNFEENLQIYLSTRAIQIDEEGLLYRLEKIRSFYLEEGVTFFDFYAFLYPKIASGLDRLTKIAGPIIKRKAGHGSALFFITRSWLRYKLSSKQKRAVAEWLDLYTK